MTVPGGRESSRPPPARWKREMTMDHRYPTEAKRHARRRTCHAHLPMVGLVLSGVGRTQGGTIEVTLAATGQTVKLPWQEIQFAPGRVYVPAWLYRRVRPYLAPGRPPHQPR